MPVSSSAQNKLARALGDQPSAAEYTDAIDANTVVSALQPSTAGVVEALKVLVVDASSRLNALTITTLTVTTLRATTYQSQTGNGAIADAIASNGAASEQGNGFLHQTKISLMGAQPITITNDAGTGFGNLKLYDFPAGRILILGVTADLAVNWSADSDLSNTGSGDFALGTTGTSDTTIDGTDVNLLPSTGMTDPFVVGVGEAVGALAASAQFDGTTSAVDVYLNMIVDNGDVTDDAEVQLSGSITITWINLGDY